MFQVSPKITAEFLLCVFCFSLAPSIRAAEEQENAQISRTEIKERAVALPKAVAGVLAGLTVGVPVKIGKDVRHETRRLAGTLRADVGNDFGILENLIVLGGALPFGILGGTILGTIRGTEHAFTYGSHQPFSKESLSLKETAQEPDKQ